VLLIEDRFGLPKLHPWHRQNIGDLLMTQYILAA